MPAPPTKARGSVWIARLFGVRLYAHWSLLIIFALIAVSLGGRVFPAWHPEWSAFTSWTVALSAALLFLASIAVHELSHALVGRRQGFEVEHIVLFVFGGMARSRGEPTSPKGELLTAAVGPLTSLVIGLAATLIGTTLAADAIALRDIDPRTALASVGPIATLLLWLGPVNILLGVFNLIPGFPLDGGRVLRAGLWWWTGDMTRATRWAAHAGQATGWFFVMCGALMVLGVPIPIFGVGLVPGLWLALIGWFVASAAQSSFRGLLIRDELQHVPVRMLMRSDLVAVRPDLPLSELVSDYLMKLDQRAFPVREGDGPVLGLVCLEDLRKVPRDVWPATPVRDAMTPAAALRTLELSDDGMTALQSLGEYEVDQLPVFDHGALRGMVRREEIMKWLTLHVSELPR